MQALQWHLTGRLGSVQYRDEEEYGDVEWLEALWVELCGTRKK